MTTDHYRPRPTPIRALQWTGDNADAMATFAGDRFTETESGRLGPALKETDYDDWFDLRAGDWVVRREGGWFGVLDDTEFTDLYEADAEQPKSEPITVDAFARALHDAQVRLHKGDFPEWDELSTAPGRGQDEVRMVARWLLERLFVTERAAKEASRG